MPTILQNSLTASLRARLQNDMGSSVKPRFTTENLNLWNEALVRVQRRLNARV